MGEDVPRTFGPYEILDEIGRGGMGVVFRARHPGLGRVVALKTLLDRSFASSEDEERFLSEARTLAKLRHPGIVPLFDCGRADGHVFFTMQLLEGLSLEDLLRRFGAAQQTSTTIHELSKIA